MDKKPNTSRPKRPQSNPDLTRLIREIKRLNESVTRIEQRLDKIEENQQDQFPKTIVRDIKETHDRVFKEAISNAREHKEILGTLAQLQTEKKDTEQSQPLHSQIREDVPESL
jgi:HSP90 family molecular chaperone